MSIIVSNPFVNKKRDLKATSANAVHVIDKRLMNSTVTSLFTFQLGIYRYCYNTPDFNMFCLCPRKQKKNCEINSTR